MSNYSFNVADGILCQHEGGWLFQYVVLLVAQTALLNVLWAYFSELGHSVSDIFT